MLWFAALALSTVAAPPPAPMAGRAAVQATATVRVLSGVRLRFGDISAASSGATLRNATIRTADGTAPARLYEFE